MVSKMRNFKKESHPLSKEASNMYDVNKIRKDFPMLNDPKASDLIFLDNASTTFKPQCVLDAMNEYYTTYTANSHRGDYDTCFKADTKIAETRKLVAEFVNCDENEVVFTAGTTMSINLIAYGYAMKFLKAGDEIVIDEGEHASNSLPWFKVAEKTGAVIKFIPLNEKGAVTKENLVKTLSNRTKIVALAAVTNVLGCKIDVKEFAKEIHKVGAIFALDGAQSVPHMKTDFKDLDVDFLSFSGHKMLGPTGVGCLIGKYDLLDKMDSFLVGGGMNVTFSKDVTVEVLNPPVKFEAGTLNIAGIIGLGAAIKYINSIGIDNIEAYEHELKAYAIKRFSELDDIIVYNKDTDAGIVTFNRKGIFSQDEATLLNYRRIAVRSGQHCAKMLNGFIGCESTLRASFYLYTSKEDIDRLVDVLKEKGDILDAYFN